MQQDRLSTGILIALGVAIGSGLGVALHNLPAGLAIGLGIASAYGGTRALIHARRKPN